jgi:hypothetical protein
VLLKKKFVRGRLLLNTQVEKGIGIYYGGFYVFIIIPKVASLAINEKGYFFYQSISLLPTKQS